MRQSKVVCKTVVCMGLIPGHWLCCDLGKSHHLSVPQVECQENEDTTSWVTVKTKLS